MSIKGFSDLIKESSSDNSIIKYTKIISDETERINKIPQPLSLMLTESIPLSAVSDNVISILLLSLPLNADSENRNKNVKSRKYACRQFHYFKHSS